MAVTQQEDVFRPAVIDDVLDGRPNIFESRLALLYAALTTHIPGKSLSIGGGTGRFEYELAHRYGLVVDRIVEPSPSLAETARSRGFDVEVATAQEATLAPESYDTIFYNGSSFGFIPDDELEPTFAKTLAGLRPGGRLVLTDVPKESALGILLLTYQKAQGLDTSLLEDLIEGTSFYNHAEHVYKPYWHTTRFYADLLERVGFRDLRFKQSVIVNPPYQDDHAEQPIDGFDKGNYVAIIARKPAATHQPAAEGDAR